MKNELIVIVVFNSRQPAGCRQKRPALLVRLILKAGHPFAGFDAHRNKGPPIAASVSADVK